MPSDDARLIAAARAYVDALVSHDPSAVPLHPACTRTELGVTTGRDGRHIARSLAHGPQFRLIHAVGDFTATVSGRRVETTFVVHVRPKALGLGARVVESFEFDDEDLITRIVARFSPPRRV
ncbi:MAG: hypothetical protein QM809_01815 [Gordonia sp. (in: high G+C Gram-positive bacteria)]|uniref:hypothetical protein n=1 Tax=Gordonia sp. (in: high G+C Gram-positive bacteria) TaxID=84139 RepID=UPI0039E698C3